MQVFRYVNVPVLQQPFEIPGEVPEVEVFEVDLRKDTHGLGITIAGYVGGDNTPGQLYQQFFKAWIIFVNFSLPGKRKKSQECMMNNIQPAVAITLS